MSFSYTTTLALRRPLAVAYCLTARHIAWVTLLAAILQCAIALVAVPSLAGLFSVSTRAAGVSAVTTTDVAQFLSSPLGVALAVLSLVLTMLALLLQNGIYLVVAWLHQSEATPTMSTVARRLLSRFGTLLRRPSSFLLIPYLMVVLPLAHIGIGSALTGWVTVPAFVSDELLKEPMHAVIYTAAMLLIWYVNLRLIFTVPQLLLTDADAATALARSWQLTRWRSVSLLVALVGVVVPLAVAMLAVTAIAALPVFLSDALAPSASPVVASVAFGLAQFVGFILVGLFLLVQSHVLVWLGRDLGCVADAPADSPPLAAPARSVSRRAALASVGGSVLVVAVLSAHSFVHLTEFATGATTVLAHRGFTAHGVENTIEALDAANDAGADVVEMDVQQTADGGWALMHDTDLRRLAGVDTSVGQLTLAEATAVTVHDELGHSGAIPSLEHYLQRADELEQQLLIEIKVHGRESPDYLAELIALIDRVDRADQHIYHSLSPDVVAEFARLRPDLQIGYIVPLSYGGFPEESPADFFVVEQGVYSPQLRDEIWAHGRSLLVWTVEDANDMRALFRDSVDGIISDRPDIAAAELSSILNEKGMTDRLFDALRRSVSF